MALCGVCEQRLSPELVSQDHEFCEHCTPMLQQLEGLTAEQVQQALTIVRPTQETADDRLDTILATVLYMRERLFGTAGQQ